MVRFKNRYLLCFIDTEYGTDADTANVQGRDIISAVRSSLSTNFGDHAVGQSMASLALKLWSPALGLCIIRCSRDYFRTIWAATSLVTGLPGSNHLGRVRLSVVHVGGTIRSCQKSAAQYARGIIFDKARIGQDTEKTKAAVVGMKRQLDAMDI